VRAFILAGGLGTRLAPYTTVLPKPLMPLGNSTILETLVRSLAASSISDVTISLGYLGHLVRAVMGDGSALGVQVSYTEEPEPLGTAGALRLMTQVADDDVVLSVNGDTLTDFDFRQVETFLREMEADAVIVVKERSTTLDFGVVDIDADGLLAGYAEKPTFTHLVSTGINALTGRAIRLWLGDGHMDMPDLMTAIGSGGGRVACLRTEAAWLDLGRPEDLAAAHALTSGE
jgi:NDP-mannose synthase